MANDFVDVYMGWSESGLGLSRGCLPRALPGWALPEADGGLDRLDRSPVRLGRSPVRLGRSPVRLDWRATRPDRALGRPNTLIIC